MKKMTSNRFPAFITIKVANFTPRPKEWNKKLRIIISYDWISHIVCPLIVRKHNNSNEKTAKLFIPL